MMRRAHSGRSLGHLHPLDHNNPVLAILSLFLFSSLLSFGLAKQQNIQTKPVISFKRWKGPMKDEGKNLASFSTSSPITALLAANHTAVRNFPRLFTLISTLDSAIVANAPSLDVSTRSRAPQYINTNKKRRSAVPTCENRNDHWRTDLFAFHTIRGLPVPGIACVSDIESGSPLDEYVFGMSEDEAFDLVRDHAQCMRGAAQSAPAAWKDDAQMGPKLANWVVNRPGSNRRNSDGKYTNKKDPFATGPADFIHMEKGQRCNIDHAGFIRNGSIWYTLVTFTNALQHVVKRKGEREFLHEYVALNGANPTPVHLARPQLARNFSTYGGIKWNSQDWIPGTTTVRQFSKGSMTPSAFSPEFPRENLAIQRALELGAHDSQQAADATTLSNIAILAFPLVANVVPVALIADVNTIGMLAYTLFTDVLTAVPLAIKGVEILSVAARRNRAVIARITGGNLPPPSVELTPEGGPVVKAAEIWVAECHPTGSLRATGVTLLTVAMIFMVGGIIAEVWARNYVKAKEEAEAVEGSCGTTLTCYGSTPGYSTSGSNTEGEVFVTPSTVTSLPASVVADMILHHPTPPSGEGNGIFKGLSRGLPPGHRLRYHMRASKVRETGPIGSVARQSSGCTFHNRPISLVDQNRDHQTRHEQQQKEHEIQNSNDQATTNNSAMIYPDDEAGCFHAGHRNGDTGLDIEEAPSEKKDE